MDAERDDRMWMDQALALAALGEGTTSPNPRVGCVVVRDGRVAGSGYHRTAGGAHAETLAVERAGERAQGATVYVNLEPCAHHGLTPPCVELLVRAGIRRVVASIQDPNPLVDGRGFERLRRAGVLVDVGVRAAEAAALNAPFVHWHRTGRPAVTLKAAMSLDGMLSAAAGRSRWITGDVARRVAHRLRARHDALLVGAGTVRADDPRLDVRLPGVGAAPLRAVISASLDLDPAARLFDRAAAGRRVRVYTAPDARAPAGLEGRAECVPVGWRDGELDLRDVLADLARQGAQSVLVEGGGRTLAAFLRQGLGDHAALFVSPGLLGALGATPLLMLDAAEDPRGGWRLERQCLLALGEDALLCGRLVPPAGRGA